MKAHLEINEQPEQQDAAFQERSRGRRNGEMENVGI